MPVLFCPRCQRANPEAASFCHYDGAELRSRQDGSFHRLAREFVFPSGRRCATFDDFAQGCRDEWPAARDLLRQGTFLQFFGGLGRTDLAKAAQEAAANQDADIALTMFLEALPVIQTQVPKIGINPRRLMLGNLLAGEQRQLQLFVTNQGQGNLQGTMTVTEGNAWLKIDGAAATHCAIATQREQIIPLLVQTRGLPAGGTFGAKLTVITNGGVVEVLARMDLVAQPFAKQPFQGVKTPREMAERMRKFPKVAVPMLENGEVSRWFAGNGWNFPVRGTQAKGVAGVQQFFETMGLSKAPLVQLAQSEVRLGCMFLETVRAQLVMQTAAKKWVYAEVASDSPWLHVLTPQVSGPQQATIAFEVDPRGTVGSPLEGNLRVTANGGKVLTAKVIAEVRGAPPARVEAPSPKDQDPIIVSLSGGLRIPRLPARWFGPILTMAIAFFLLRLCLVPLVDLGGRAAAATAAAAKLDIALASDSPLSATGGWLQLPWGRIMSGMEGALPVKMFNAARTGEISTGDFRHYYTSYFLRWLVLWTWWVGAASGGVLMYKYGGGMADLPWGIIAGAVAGVAAGITVGSVFLVVEIVPQALWGLLFAGPGSGPGMVILWVVCVLASWTGCGALAGLLVASVPSGLWLLQPLQKGVARLCRWCGLYRLERLCGT